MVMIKMLNIPFSCLDSIENILRLQPSF
uniref:Uncharacterized protein n=1 Tax=Anguilla anguilla TaxID=7936 RepID=A0A0E9PZS8_ANGAN